jgi:uncharacterized membrane protein SpoIIM required for sporulation
VKQHAFEAVNVDAWQRYEGELAALDSSGIRMRLPIEAVEPFVVGYRQISRDLAIARARGYTPALIARLNELVVRGHNVIYVRRAGFGRRIAAFFIQGFPRLVRAQRRYVFAAAAAMLLPALLIGVAIDRAPETIYSVMSADTLTEIEAMYDPTATHYGRARASDSNFAMFGFYVRNNISISFQLFATGVLAGIGTLLYLVYNGLMLGAVGVHLIKLGYFDTFVPFVIGHGAFELTAIVLAGAGGLMMGHALLDPGRLPRRAALQRAGRVAVRLLLGAVVMLLVAAFVEAFWSSIRGLPSSIKLLVGVALWVGVLGYFVAAGRGYGSRAD